MPHKTSRSAEFTTPVLRIAYPYVHEKRTKDADKKDIPVEKQKHELVGLVPKLHTDPLQCPNYKLFADIAMQAIAGCTDFGGQFPAGGQWPIKDGDQKRDKYPWQAGHWVVKFSSMFPVRVALLQGGQPVEIPAKRMPGQMNDAYKSGDYGIVSGQAFTYDEKSKGVKFGFSGVLWVGAGEAIGQVQRTAAQMFAGVGNVALPPGAQAIGAVPNGAPQPNTAPPIPNGNGAQMQQPNPPAPSASGMPLPPAPQTNALPPIPGR